MILDILDFAVDLALDDTVHLRTLALFAWPRARAWFADWLRIIAAAVLEQIEDLAAYRREALADRQLLAQLRRCA